MTLKGGTSQACAACKYQRRKCTSECPLAPYFPADQPNMFQNAHRLFGVSNILKILKHLDPSQKSVAMDSIRIQANIRERFPVHGCWGIINQLYCQLQQSEEELHAVLSHLALYRDQHQQQQQQQQQEISSAPVPNDTCSQLQLGMAPPNNNDNNNNNVIAALPITTQHSYSNSNNNAAFNSNYIDFKDSTVNSSLWTQQHAYSTSNNNNIDSNNPMGCQSQFISSQPLAIQQEPAQEYDELHPFFDTIDDRQSYIDSKEAYESSSSESSLKDTTQSIEIEHVAENELKSAAACFSLTSVN